MPHPVLAYHAMNVVGDDYADNDHVALREDLEVIHAAGYTIIPGDWLVEWLRAPERTVLPSKPVVLTCDDGSYFDYYDMDHPAQGRQRSFFNILRDFQRRHGMGAQPHLHMSAFVIASPGAREQLDRRCMIGRGWWGDEWWREAAESGLMGIENHSWDHSHPELGEVAHRGGRQGHFDTVADYRDCHAEVVTAADYIAERAGRRPRLFAYPWGRYSTYLAETFFPRYEREHGMLGAFACGNAAVAAGTSPWAVPRLVCGEAWHSPAELRALLARLAGEALTGAVSSS